MRGEGEGNIPLSHDTSQQMNGGAHSLDFALGTGSSTPSHLDQLYCVSQARCRVRGGARSPALMTPGPTLITVTDGEGARGCLCVVPSYSRGGQHSFTQFLGPAHLCPNHQGLFCRVVQARCRVCSPKCLPCSLLYPHYLEQSSNTVHAQRWDV